MLGAALVVVFVAALSMRVQQVGWSFFILCFVVGSLGGLSLLWIKGRVQANWNQLPKSKRIPLTALAIALVLAAIFLGNRHEPNEAAADVMECLSVLLALALLGLYRVWSRFLDNLHSKFSKR